MQDSTDSSSGAGYRRRRNHRTRRNERVLHTRISDQLADDIRQVADDLRVPVSNLVRNVLEEAFGALERVSGDVGDLVDDVLGEAERARDRFAAYRERRARQQQEADVARAADEARSAFAEPDPDPEPAAPRSHADREPVAGDADDVYGWQELRLARPVRCGGCGRAVARGERAFVGVSDGPGPRAWRCPRCAEPAQP